MIKRFFAWLKSIYYHPATTAETIKETVMPNVLTLTLVTNNSAADGVSVNNAQVKVADANGVAVISQTVNLSADAAVTIPTSVVTDSTGTASFSLTSSTAGSYPITAALEDGTSASATAVFAAVPVTGVGSAAVTPVGSSGSDSATVSVSTESPLASLKARVEAFVAFVEHGLEVLGADAEAELVALKDKYL